MMTDVTAGTWEAWGLTNRRWWLGAALLVLMGAAATGCSLDGLLNSDKLPADVSDPALTQTPQGARAAYAGTLAQVRVAFGVDRPGNSAVAFVALTGVLSDELHTSHNGALPALDRRVVPEGAGHTDAAYSALQQVRGQAAQAIGLLTRYVPEESALAGRLYALQGYAEVFLAEVFCSGIPLGTLDYEGDYTYQPGSSTVAVFTHAAALFDTALALAGDSVHVADLARVGRGRALLALGRYADAAAAVAGVADGYHYDVHYAQNAVQAN